MEYVGMNNGVVDVGIIVVVDWFLNYNFGLGI